jgi:lysophospholipase L1-like esterase
MRKKLMAVGLTLMATLVTGGFVTPANAVTTPTTINAVAIGDSYTAGNGAGSYSTWLGCMRSRENWSNQYVTHYLGTLPNVKTTYRNLACSGAVTSQILTQAKSIPAGTNLVMFTAGGNDVNFTRIVTKCFAPKEKDGPGCDAALRYAEGRWSTTEEKGKPGPMKPEADQPMNQVMVRTEAILNEIDKKLPDNATVVLVGYPLLSTPDTSFELCMSRKWWGGCNSTMKPAPRVRALGQTARDKQKALVAKWNQTHALKVTYIDLVEGLDRKSTRLNSSHNSESRMPSSA